LADGSTVTADESYIRESILTPNAKIVAGYQPVMPAYQGQITEEQTLDLISYVRSLQAEPVPPKGAGVVQTGAAAGTVSQPTGKK
jgi:cytochrome c oxidase subunit 2